jgi:hypothetical protein
MNLQCKIYFSRNGQIELVHNNGSSFLLQNLAKSQIFFKECNELLGFGLLEIEKIQAKIGRFFRFSFSK